MNGVNALVMLKKQGTYLRHTMELFVEVFAKFLKLFTVYIHPLPLTALVTQHWFPLNNDNFVLFVYFVELEGFLILCANVPPCIIFPSCCAYCIPSKKKIIQNP